jgi:hypothetical protein
MSRTAKEVVMDSELDYYTQNAKGIAFDTCHKIYVLMDDEQVALMRQYEYDPLITSEEMTPEEMSATVLDWFEQSCGLRFINAVSTHPTNPNEGFVDIVAQFEMNEDDEDGDE